jgi:hypothetical protein
MKTIKYFLIASLAIVFMNASCKKKKADPHVPPGVEFKHGGNYVDGDRSAGKSDTLLVGITATKTEDDLKSYNVSYAYDGATASTTFYNYLMNDSEKTGYSHDVEIITRSQAGSERWVFSIVDRDGNITQKTIVLTVK